MNKILAVAKAEYGSAIRSKAFIIGVLLTPVIMGVSIFAQKFLKQNADVTDRACAIVDRSGVLYPHIESANEERERSKVFQQSEAGERKQVLPNFRLERYTESDDPEQTHLDLSRRVRKGELFAYLVIDKEILDTDKTADPKGYSLAYHTKTPTYDALPDWLRKTINQSVTQLRFESADLDPKLVRKLSKPVWLTSLGLVSASKNGKVKSAKRDSELETIGIPFGSMMLLFMLILSATPALLSQVLEEKTQKISEVLLSSVSPFQLLMGKLMGTVGVTLTLSTLYLGSAYYLSRRYGFADAIPAANYAWFLLLLVVALFMFGSVFSAIGAASTEIKDSQNLMTPVMLLFMMPMFFVMLVIESPNGTIATVLSLFPPSTPLIMMLRISLSPGPPLWQILLAVGLSGAFTVFCVAAAGKIFRIGILSQGQTPTVAQLFKWVFSK